MAVDWKKVADTYIVHRDDPEQEEPEQEEDEDDD